MRRSGRGKRSAEDSKIPSVPAVEAEEEEAVKESDRTDGPTPGGDEQEQHSRTEAEGDRNLVEQNIIQVWTKVINQSLMRCFLEIRFPSTSMQMMLTSPPPPKF